MPHTYTKLGFLSQRFEPGSSMSKRMRQPGRTEQGIRHDGIRYRDKPA